MGDGYHLVTSVKDEYLVEMDVLVPYHSARKTGMMIWVPRYTFIFFPPLLSSVLLFLLCPLLTSHLLMSRAAENVISFTVNVRDIQIKVDPSFVGEEHNSIISFFAHFSFFITVMF